MTGPQTQYYFSLWNAACRANGWHMESCRLVLDKTKDSEFTRAVFTLADQLAKKQHRAKTIDDIRHASHWFALGQAISSKQIGTREFGRVKVLFRLIADSDDLAARMAWLNPEDEDRKVLLWTIRSMAPEAYTRAISADKFQTKEWEGLPVSFLRQLVITLKGRRGKWNKHIQKPLVYDETNAPY